MLEKAWILWLFVWSFYRIYFILIITKIIITLMKKFSINCNFEGGAVAPFTIFIGMPEDKHHPLYFQNDWLSKEKGGQIPPNVMEAISKLVELSKANNISLEELCVYTLGSDEQKSEEEPATNTDEDDSIDDLLNDLDIDDLDIDGLDEDDAEVSAKEGELDTTKNKP
jgi:hypothetical protein